MTNYHEHTCPACLETEDDPQMAVHPCFAADCPDNDRLCRKHEIEVREEEDDAANDQAKAAMDETENRGEE